MGFMTVDESTYMPINGFTTVDLGCELRQQRLLSGTENRKL